MMTQSVYFQTNPSKLKIVKKNNDLDFFDDVLPAIPTARAFQNRIHALDALIKTHSCAPAVMVGTILRIWCKSAFPALPKSSLPYLPALTTEPDVIAIVNELDQLEFLDAAYWLSSVYTILSDKEHRKQLAMFFTPPSLTQGLLDDLERQGINFDAQSFCDPACGGAAFLVPIALRMRKAMLAKSCKPLKLLKHIEANIFGTDLEKTLCKLSKHFLCMALHEEIKLTKYVPNFKIYEANSLASLDSKFNSFDVVVCNPPYRKMISEELLPLREKYEDIIEGQPNLYGLFTKLCIQLLKINGHAALVTPTSFLSGQNFSLLRKYILCHANVLHIGMVSERRGVFIDVDQETALTILKKCINNFQSHTKVSAVSKDGEYKNVGDCFLANTRHAWPIPRTIEDVAILKAASNSHFRLHDYGYRIRIGAYVWNRDKRPKFVSEISAKRAKAHTALPLLWARDISNGQTIKLENLLIINDRSRFVDLGNKKHSSVVTSPSVIMQRVTSNEQPRRLVAAAVSSDIFETYGGFIGENHTVILEQIVPTPTISPKNLAKLLSTKMIDRYFRCISGATNVSVFELNQLALPDPAILKLSLKNRFSMDDAVKKGFGFLD